ncbi:RNA polymerase sigma factor [Flavobacteriales bacterium]|nr:RNA polymerase sigma factor [Flavobacteriales bacterium]
MCGDFYTNSILPYAGIIIKICRAYSNSQEDFEDYYQEVCLQIWRSKDNFTGNSEWSTWIYRLSLNVCMTLRKRENNRNLQILKSNELPEIANQELFSFQDKYLEELYTAIKQLSELNRAIIVLHLEEKSYKEIAFIIGTNSNNIGVRIQRIKKKLKQLIFKQL